MLISTHKLTTDWLVREGGSTEGGEREGARQAGASKKVEEPRDIHTSSSLLSLWTHSHKHEYTII
jgi:hypothetical protein